MLAISQANFVPPNYFLKKLLTTIKEALERAFENLSFSFIKSSQNNTNKGLINHRSDAILLLSSALLCSKERVIFNPELEINSDQEKLFFDLIERRKNREPISHLLGKREFFGVDFVVNRNVLDPRPDSETLIEMVLSKFKDSDDKLNILELGVGSGCLIISLLLAHKSWLGIGVDISQNALSVCLNNAKNHFVDERLNLVNSDLFSALNRKEKFDLIISNPPYIPSHQIENLEPEVSVYEPLIALDGGVDGLDFYRRIALEAKDFLAKEGSVFLEIGFGQKEEIVKIFLQQNFSLNSEKLDLSGICRVLEFVNKNQK